MVCTNPCDDCKREGLPILFTRYAVGYSSRSEGLTLLDKFKPTGKLQAQPGGVSIKTGRYGVRMLRAGYLYLRIERRGLLEWEGYAIHPHGYLKQFPVMLPQQAEVKIACARDARQANNSLVWIKDAKNVKSLWYAFHPDPIDPAHLKREIEPNPAKYMQQFDVAGWLGGNTSQADSMQPAQLDKQVLEYAALGDEKVQVVGNEQFFGLMGTTPLERAWGNWAEAQTRVLSADDYGRTQEDIIIVQHRQPTYARGHGGRLKQMADFLQQNKGAVVVCGDPIGIAQELSMHHLTAAIPYVGWLQEVDAKGVSNHWKQATSEAIGTISRALGKNYLQTYDEQTDNLRRTRENMGQHYPGSDSSQPVRVRGANGSYETISVQELNRRRTLDLDQQISARDSDRGLIARQSAEALGRSLAAPYCDLEQVDRFNTTHAQKLRDRDQLMDKLAADLQHWLGSPEFIEVALGRYNENAGVERGDGIRCAGQLLAILNQVASAPKGRQWYAQLDLFTPSKKNLVWRVLSLNNTTISAELQSAVASLRQPVTVEMLTAQDNAVRSKAWSDLSSAISKMSKTLGAADKIPSEADNRAKPDMTTGKRVDSYLQMGKAVNDGPLGILFVALLAWLKNQPATKWEINIARAQALTLAYGLGNSAAAYVRSQQNRGSGLAAVFKHEIGQALGKLVESKATEMRMNYTQFSLGALALIPTLLNVPNKANKPRALLEVAGGLAGVLGAYRQLGADRYEKYVFKNVPDALSYMQDAKVITETSKKELLALKAGAARYVIAGAVVGVAFDLIDGNNASEEGERGLRNAYYARSAVGGGSLVGTFAAARYTMAPLWLTRTNLYLAIATLLLSAAIEILKGTAWANWLQATPFRKADSKKIPYKNEEETMNQFSEVLSGL
ncbi:hypothetical protein LMG6871_04825 [Ralstonia edaphis]|uniref:T6SS effector BTH_I2691 family protein n=1 Tax=Ralstonia edaphi TaxID=3058599 RepID=UPI0028F6810A|nr:T6SS effector BTH_I2691 family protein [Ralstonia sp. LMG 6871]CAJ0721400.1 hypothetical protein LMG6871_04825 [Ralstonia sp. LMG 6871]